MNKGLKIGIVGLGLIGGSILKALKPLDYYTLAVTKSSVNDVKPYANVVSSELDILKDADIVFVCSQMNKTLAVLDSLEDIVSNDTIVTDVCSLKEFVATKPRPYKFIPSHPMAGTEFSGFNNSFATLFEDAKWILTEENSMLEGLIDEMGAKPVIMDANSHDKSAALISHLPMLVAMALFQNADDDSKIIASSGFRDMTRLCMTNSTLAYDMLTLNKENIDKSIESLISNLNEIKNLEKNKLVALLDSIANERQAMYDINGKNRL